MYSRNRERVAPRLEKTGLPAGSVLLLSTGNNDGRLLMRTKIYFLRGENRFVVYVGMTVYSLEDRLYHHLYEARKGHRCKKCNGIRKMLREGKTPTITLQTEVNNGPAAEMAYIKWLRSKGVELWNLTDGGEGCVGYSHSEETKRHLSKTVGATCRKLGSNKGEKNPFYGKKHSEKTKQKLSASHKGLRPWIAGKHHSEKTKLQMSKSHKGIKFSKERCLAISIAHQGLVPPWCEGKHRH